MTDQRSVNSKELEVVSSEVSLEQEAAQLESGTLPCDDRNCEECSRHYGRRVRKQQAVSSGI